jgi:hypothetical protein
MSATTREVFRGVVSDNDDPEQRGRILVRCAALVGADGNGQAREYPIWLEPTLQAGWADSNGDLAGASLVVPTIGTVVEVSVNTSSPGDQVEGMTMLMNPDPRYGGVPMLYGALPAALLTNYPKRRGTVSENKHHLVFDDKEDRIELKHGKTAQGGYAVISIEGDGRVVLQDGAGQKITLEPSTSPTEQRVRIESHGHTITLEKEKIEIKAATGKEIVLNPSGNNPLGGVTPAVGRVGDAVDVAPSLASFMAATVTALSTIAAAVPIVIVPPVPPTTSVGKISEGSSSVKAG